jgi:hypothetical protein
MARPPRRLRTQQARPLQKIREQLRATSLRWWQETERCRLFPRNAEDLILLERTKVSHGNLAQIDQWLMPSNV